MNREITGKDMIYFLLLSVILTFCVVIANKVETNAKTPEITTDKPTEAVTEAVTEKSPAAEETTEIELTTVKYEDIPKLKELGNFRYFAYCNEEYPHICNDGPPYLTKMETKPTANRTVAVDPDVIPLGAKLYINGKYYIAEDTGPNIKGNRIDICFDSHEEANNFGTGYVKVFLVVE